MGSAPMSDRVPTGIAELDRAIEGGLPQRRVSLVTGDVGAGKTTLGLQFLAEGARVGERGLFVAIDQKPAHIVEAASRFGWPVGLTPDAPVLVLDGSPALTLMRDHRHDVDARAVLADLTPHLRSRGITRLVIDTLPALTPPRLSEAGEEAFCRDLAASLDDNAGCTTLLIASDGDARAARISAVMSRFVTGVIDLRLREAGGRLTRGVLVRKMRATMTSPDERPFEIGATGLVVDPA